jgi:3-methyladenine DNA glycosylase AlkD
VQSACVNEIVKRFIEQADAQAALPMKQYLRNQFEFIGLPTPARVALTKPWVKEYEFMTEERLENTRRSQA